jgi:hypothetical protein
MVKERSKAKPTQARLEDDRPVVIHFRSAGIMVRGQPTLYHINARRDQIRLDVSGFVAPDSAVRYIKRCFGHLWGKGWTASLQAGKGARLIATRTA